MKKGEDIVYSPVVEDFLLEKINNNLKFDTMTQKFIWKLLDGNIIRLEPRELECAKTGKLYNY